MPHTTPRRYRCTECAWVGTENEFIMFADPEKEGNSWQLCPQCRASEQFELLCYQCNQLAGIGTPIPGDYIWSCFKHHPKP